MIRIEPPMPAAASQVSARVARLGAAGAGAAGLRTALEAGCGVYTEVGPGRVPVGLTRLTAPARR